jgi:RimJ/RimL family protein N-acetyltransferase
MSVLLRPLEPERDGAALHAIFGDEESCRYMAQPATQSVDETVRMLTKWSEGCASTCWALVEQEDGEALGRIAMIPRGRDIFEAACMTVPNARGRGLAGKGLALAIDIAFDNLGARRIFADIDPDNRASIRVFEKLGFRYEGLLRANWQTHIGVRDSVIMGLIDSDPQPWR